MEQYEYRLADDVCGIPFVDDAWCVKEHDLGDALRKCTHQGVCCGVGLVRDGRDLATDERVEQGALASVGGADECGTQQHLQVRGHAVLLLWLNKHVIQALDGLAGDRLHRGREDGIYNLCHIDGLGVGVTTTLACCIHNSIDKLV